MFAGVVKWFNETHGSGFIESDGETVFVNFSEIRGTGAKTLRPGQRVLFEKIEGYKGPQACEVIPN